MAIPSCCPRTDPPSGVSRSLAVSHSRHVLPLGVRPAPPQQLHVIDRAPLRPERGTPCCLPLFLGDAIGLFQGVEYSHDTPPDPFMPSPTFAHSSNPPAFEMSSVISCPNALD